MDSTEHAFRLPRDFLTRRSNPFRLMLDGRFCEAATGVIRLPTTAVTTFQHVAIWVMSPEPQLNILLSLPITVDIAIFATMYDMPALLHQALDRMRSAIVSTPTALTLELVDQIYSHVDEHCLLRKFIQAAISVLGNLSSTSQISTSSLKDWQDVFERHSALGSDYFTACVKGWSQGGLAEGGPCRFHRHGPRDLSRPVPFQVNLLGSQSCPRLFEECFEQVQISPFGEQWDSKSRQIKLQVESSDDTKQTGASTPDRSNTNSTQTPFSSYINRR